MADFSRHFRMHEQDAIDYIREKLDFFCVDAVLKCTEIGDGNINYVFRVEDEISKKSIIVKHADIRVRSSSGTLSVDRCRIEAEALKLEGSFTPHLVPKLYLFDPVMCCTVMEDIGAYKNMRYAMIAHEIFPRFADDITTFMAETLIRTSDCIMDPFKKKELVKKFINPPLCDISERLVYTDPYTNASGRNKLFEPNEDFLKKELYHDPKLLLEAAKLKYDFENKSQSLIHGDLHTGSIFVKPEGTMILDPEFAFAGPAGYDVGNVMANLIFAWVNASVTMADKENQKVFINWLEETIRQVIDDFYSKSLAILSQDSSDVMFHSADFSRWFMESILVDTAGVTGLEINRRIIGSAKVKDIAGIEVPEQRVLAERICVLTAKQCIFNRETAFQKGSDYIDVLHSIWKAVKIA